MTSFKMKNVLFTVFRLLIFLVLAGKVLNWLLHFSVKTNQVLNVIMFTLIGIAYIVMGFVWDNKPSKAVIAACGVYLIGMNFFASTPALNIMAIVCIVTPLVMARLQKKDDSGVHVSKVE